MNSYKSEYFYNYRNDGMIWFRWYYTLGLFQVLQFQITRGPILKLSNVRQFNLVEWSKFAIRER